MPQKLSIRFTAFAVAFSIAVFVLPSFALSSPSPFETTAVSDCSNTSVDRALSSFPAEVRATPVLVAPVELLEFAAHSNSGAITPAAFYRHNSGSVYLAEILCQRLAAEGSLRTPEGRRAYSVLLHELAHAADHQLGLLGDFSFSDSSHSHQSPRSVGAEIFADCVAQFMGGELRGCSAGQMAETKKFAFWLT